MNILALKISPEILRLIGEIDEFKGSWREMRALAPERLAGLRRVATIESIGSSTRIEGSKLTDAQVEELLDRLEQKTFVSRDEQEVAGYAEAMETVFDSYADILLTENYLKQLHAMLLRYSTKDERHRGEYKKLPNNVEAFDADGKSLGVVFETASPFDTPFRMQELVAWTREAMEDRAWHPLVIIGLFIVAFLEIHPFQDGNGRLSRVLTTLLLLQAGYGYAPYSSLESIIEANKEGYYLALRRTQGTMRGDHPDYEPWLLFFLRSLKKQKDRLEERLATLKSASEEVAQKLERKAERALAWLVGQRTKKSTLTDIVAEDEQQEFPPVLAFQKEFARIAAMIRANETQPYVEPEAQLSFVEEAEDGTQVDHLADIRAVMQELAPLPQGVDPNMDPAAAALASMPQPEQMSDNEIVAAILSARLDRLCERLKMNTLSTLILQQAALDTVVYVHVGYDPREDQSEPTVIEILPAGDVLTDREAPTAHRGRFVGRIERDVRLAEVARRYNKPIDDLRELATQPVDTDNVTVPEDLKYVELVHWWVRNESTVEVPTAIPMDATGMVDAEEAEEQMEAAFGEDESEDLAEDATEEEVEEVEEVEDGDDMEPETILKYEGGWQYVVTMNGRVIFNGDSPSADGAPQVYEFGWWPTAQRPYTIGMYDMMVPYTNNLDDMQKIAAESVRKMLPKTYINKAALKTPHGEDDLTDGEVAGTVHVNTGSMPVNSAVMYVPGGGAGSELMAVQDRLSASMQEVVGSAGAGAPWLARTRSPRPL